MTVREFIPDASINYRKAGLYTNIETWLSPPPPNSPRSSSLKIQEGDEKAKYFPVVHADWNASTPGKALVAKLANWHDSDLQTVVGDMCYEEAPCAVLVRRGGTSGIQKFASLVWDVAAAFPTAQFVIIANDERPLPSPYLTVVDGEPPELPAVMVSYSDAAYIHSALARGDELFVGIRCPGVAESLVFPSSPKAVAADVRADLFYVADMAMHCVWKCQRGDTPCIIAGIRGEKAIDEEIKPGMAGSKVRLEYPHDLALTSDGCSLYICEVYAVRLVDLCSDTPTISTVLHSEFGLGGIALTSGGSSLLVAEHSRHRILEVDLVSHFERAPVWAEGEGANFVGAVTVLAGTGEQGRLVSAIPAHFAHLSNPSKLGVAANGNVVFLDLGNRALRLIDRASGLVHTISDAIDAPDGLAIGPLCTVFVSEGRNHQVLQFKEPCGGGVKDEGLPGESWHWLGNQVDWDWSPCAGDAHFDEASLCHDVVQPALTAQMRKPQGLCWAAGFGLLVCDPPSRAVFLVRALTPWAWRGTVVVLRTLVEQGRAAYHGGREELCVALSLLMTLPDEEFRLIISWWWEP